MNINLENRLYKKEGGVYYGTIQKQVHNQRGRLFVCLGKKQIHLDNVPVLKEESDPVFDYVFGGGFQKFPCVAMDYWIERWRMGRKISVSDYKKKYLA